MAQNKHPCWAEGASDAMHKYLFEKMKMKEANWLVVCETKPEHFITSSDLITPSVGTLVEVACKPSQSSLCQLKSSLSFAEPFSSHFESIPRELVDHVLEEVELCASLLEAWPVECQDILYFFSDFIWRGWDGDESCGTESHVRLGKTGSRAKLHSLLKCRKRCSLFPARMKDFSMDTPSQQHGNLNVALESCYSEDHVVFFSEEYEAVNLPLLTKDTNHLMRALSYQKPKGQPQHTLGGYSREQLVVSWLLNLAPTVTGASLTATENEITGAQGTGIQLHTRSAAISESYKICHCNSTRTSKTSHHSQGAINVKTPSSLRAPEATPPATAPGRRSQVRAHALEVRREPNRFIHMQV
ncbi:testicular spindle-associated protein SHCBP1L [Athene cunicularia]|uniref:testicular spindle-associated protein SHCBP1L n=1 Tax=Athene cunicularia TaxID=194338 RepID=UPI000EF71A5A|nr:testicular spindle-associated protein SHCBP1L [Athene cunicularia]